MPRSGLSPPTASTSTALIPRGLSNFPTTRPFSYKTSAPKGRESRGNGKEIGKRLRAARSYWTVSMLEEEYINRRRALGRVRTSINRQKAGGLTASVGRVHLHETRERGGRHREAAIAVLANRQFWMCAGPPPGGGGRSRKAERREDALHLRPPPVSSTTGSSSHASGSAWHGARRAPCGSWVAIQPWRPVLSGPAWVDLDMTGP